MSGSVMTSCWLEEHLFHAPGVTSPGARLGRRDITNQRWAWGTTQPARAPLFPSPIMPRWLGIKWYCLSGPPGPEGSSCVARAWCAAQRQAVWPPTGLKVTAAILPPLRLITAAPRSRNLSLSSPPRSLRRLRSFFAPSSLLLPHSSSSQPP